MTSTEFGGPLTIPADKPGGRWHGILRVFLFAFLCALLIFGPLALGAVQEWSLLVVELGASSLLLFWLLWQVSSPAMTIEWSPLFPPMIVFALLVAGQITFHHTDYRYASISTAWLYLADAALIFISVQLLRGAFVIHFGNVFASFGAAYALFAIIQGFSSGGRIYWLMKPQAGSVYGSYVNHNHYAGLIELLLPMVLVPVFSGAAKGSRRILQAFAATLMAASVFLSGSRGGMISLAVEIIFLAIFFTRTTSRKKAALIAGAFCLITALFLAWIAPGQVSARISDFHDPSRLLILRDSVRMFRAHPFFGSGFGTFAVAFPHYRVFFDGFFVNNAHDDYLELLLETGLVGFAAGMWFLLVVYREGLKNLVGEKLSASSAVRVAALAGCTGLLAHSFVDFNLHIPGNAALFYVLCAVAAGS